MINNLLSIENIKNILTTDLPNLAIKEIKFLNEGFQNKLFLINNQIIARMSKCIKSSKLAEAGADTQKQYNNLKDLKSKLYLTPKELFRKPTTSNYPYFYYLYNYHEGEHLNYQLFYSYPKVKQEQILNKIYSFLDIMHKLEPSLKNPSNKTTKLRTLNDWRPFRELESKLLFFSKQHLNKNHYLQCVDLYKNFLQLPLNKNQSTLHGDLTSNNILINKNNDLIFIDFDNVCTGEKEFDLFRIVQSFGLSVIPQAISSLRLTDSSNLMTKLRFYLMFECIKNFNPNNKTELSNTQQEKLQKLSHQSLIYLFNNDFKNFGNFNRIFT